MRRKAREEEDNIWGDEVAEKLKVLQRREWKDGTGVMLD